MKAYEFMQRHGWKAFKEGSEWQHACPFCYVDWCRRAGVEPYETSQYTTRDEVEAHNLNDGFTDTLEPQWFVDQRQAEELRRAQKAAAPGRKKRKKRKPARVSTGPSGYEGDDHLWQNNPLQYDQTNVHDDDQYSRLQGYRFRGGRWR